MIEPTHVETDNCFCIDLIITVQPDFSVNSAAYTSLHPNCHLKVSREHTTL